MSMIHDGEGALGFPLYHGTSSYFLEYIEKFGLGAFDIISGLKAREFYKATWEMLLDISPEREKLLQRYGLRSASIIENRVSSGGGFNWRYGSIYLTGEERKAVTYASRGYGSELVRLGSGWLEEVGQISADSAYEILAAFPAMAHCLSGRHDPIVIQAPPVDIKCLRTEQGNALDNSWMDPAMSFELLAFIDFFDLKIFKAENVEMGFIGAVKYDLVPYE